MWWLLVNLLELGVGDRVNVQINTGDKPVCTLAQSDWGYSKIGRRPSISQFWQWRESIPLNVTALGFQRNTLRMIPDFYFIKFPKCRHLDLSNNWIQQLTKNTLAGLSKLQHFNISNNQLESLPLEFFKHQICLKVVDVSLNYLSILYPSTFEGIWRPFTLRLTSLKHTNCAYDPTNHWKCNDLCWLNNEIQHLKTISLMGPMFCADNGALNTWKCNNWCKEAGSNIGRYDKNMIAFKETCVNNCYIGSRNVSWLARCKIFSGSWQYSEYCTPIRCKKPTDIINGFYKLNSNNANVKCSHKVKYYCHHGHQLIGEEELICKRPPQENLTYNGVDEIGIFDNEAPDCIMTIGTKFMIAAIVTGAGLIIPLIVTVALLYRKNEFLR